MSITSVIKHTLWHQEWVSSPRTRAKQSYGGSILIKADTHDECLTKDTLFPWLVTPTTQPSTPDQLSNCEILNSNIINSIIQYIEPGDEPHGWSSSRTSKRRKSIRKLQYIHRIRKVFHEHNSYMDINTSNVCHDSL